MLLFDVVYKEKSPCVQNGNIVQPGAMSPTVDDFPLNRAMVKTGTVMTVHDEKANIKIVWGDDDMLTDA